LPGWFAAVGETVTSMRSPRIWLTMPANVGLPLRLIANDDRVRAMGSRES
jgi:hypothetical protein